MPKNPYYEIENSKLYQGDCLDTLKALSSESVQCCVTSPPYWGLRNYGVDGQFGLEKTPEEYVEKMVGIFREVKRVLKDDGTVWLNLGDSYVGGGRGGKHGVAYGGIESQNRCNAKVKYGLPTGKINGLKPKDLAGIPWRVAFALQADGWYLRSDIIWHKPNPMPESVTDRPTKSHEYIFLLTKSAKYYYDAIAIKEDSVDAESYSGIRPRNAGQMNGKDATNYKFYGSVDKNGKLKSGQTYPKRNKRSVWTVATKPYKEAHFATYPEKLIESCVLAGTKGGDTIIDPFFGAGTTGVVACKLDRGFIGIELNEKYCKIAVQRIKKETAQLKLF